MDRPIKPPPFAIGTRLRYLGDPERKTMYGCMSCKKRIHEDVFIDCFPPKVTIEEHRPGRRGTGKHIWDKEEGYWYDDQGEPVFDTTSDAYCLYFIVCPKCGGRQYGPIVDDENKDRWEVIR
jgi:hypothetical protein